MIAERLLEGRVPDYCDILEKLVEAGFVTSKGIAGVSADELARQTGISRELALTIHALAVEAESEGKVDTRGGAYVGGSVDTKGAAFIGGRVRTGGGRFVAGDDR